jgi:hypothetical protein
MPTMTVEQMGGWVPTFRWWMEWKPAEPLAFMD